MFRIIFCGELCSCGMRRAGALHTALFLALYVAGSVANSENPEDTWIESLPDDRESGNDEKVGIRFINSQFIPFAAVCSLKSLLKRKYHNHGNDSIGYSFGRTMPDSLRS